MCLSLLQGQGYWDANWGSGKRDQSRLVPLCVQSDVGKEALTLFTTLNKSNCGYVLKRQD